MTIKRVLVAIGRLPQDHAVLVRGLEIARIHGAALTIVHVVDLPGCDVDLSRLDTLHGQAALAARDTIEVALSGLGGDRVEAEIRIDAGSPALQLIAICKDLSPDIVVMRAHQKDKVAERLLGSTADRVIAGGGMPVLIVRRPVKRPYARALVATNGTDEAGDALSFVAVLLPDARLHVVQAVQITPQLEEAMLRAGTDQAALSAHLDALTRNAREHLRGLSARAARPVTTRVLQGDPATVLARASRSPNVDLIAVGPGRTSLIRRAFVGSVTRRLLRDAGCDVLVCRPAPEG